MRFQSCSILCGAAALGLLGAHAAEAADPWETMFERPLVTWALEIGNARSLPWGDPKAWNAPAPGYDVRRAPRETLTLLASNTPVLARMETLRRAVVYSQADPGIAYQLLAALTARVREAEAAGKPDVLAWFDLGYLVEVSNQAQWLKKRYLEEINGYSLVMRAIRVAGDSAPGALEMQFAAGLILLEPKGQHPYYPHFRTVVRAAGEGSLLAINLLLHLKDTFEARTLAEMRESRYLR